LPENPAGCCLIIVHLEGEKAHLQGNNVSFEADYRVAQKVNKQARSDIITGSGSDRVGLDRDFNEKTGDL
jgi:hypothetical protein